MLTSAVVVGFLFARDAWVAAVTLAGVAFIPTVPGWWTTWSGAALAAVIRLQEDAGLAVVTDGEMTSTSILDNTLTPADQHAKLRTSVSTAERVWG